ncbi:hypothetical protein EDB84DRAFT_1440316 [Lactarius hengduanensis]|nr:hypothetical protein EDB84DRAFT_1440316 [Lactarius hengduanensis]
MYADSVHFPSSRSVLSLHPEYNIEDTTLRSSLHFEKRLIKQKIEEHEISLQALKERMVDVENNIASTTHAVGTLHCYMDQVGIPIPDMAEHVAASIVFSEDDDASDSQDGDTSDSQNGDASNLQDQTLEDAATSEMDPQS